MEVNKMCKNCGKYPFCKYIVKPTYSCTKWIKRENKEVIKRGKV